MTNLGTTISSVIKNGFRIIKSKTLGANAETAETITQGCVDFSPLQNMKAVYSKTNNSSEPICIGYLNKNVISDLDSGEGAFYSIDSSGVKAYIKSRKDGTIELNGTEDYAVAFNRLKSAYDETKEVLDAILSTLGTVINEPGNGSPSAFQAAMILAVGDKTTGDISEAKVESIKLP